MIFNKGNVPNFSIEEFRAHVAILDKKTDFELICPDIENAEYEVRKIISSAVYDRAEHEYITGSVITELTRRVQSAIANIAFRDYTVNNDLRHSTTGRKASINSANEKQAWEFFIERDNDALNFKIQKSLNRLIDYLEREKIEEWTSSNAFKLKHRVLLSDIDLFGRYYPIDNSLALFNQLLPIQMEMQRKHISPLMGSLLDDIIAIDQEASGSGANDELLLLMDYAGPALALWTMATGIKRLSVKLLPEGLVQQFRSSVQSRNSSFPAQGKEKDLIISALTRDAEEATSMLENQLRIIEAQKNQVEVVPVVMGVDRNVSTNKYFSI